MGFFSESISLIAKSTIRQSAKHLAVHGGVKQQAKIIDTVSEELCQYLGKFKKQHITTEQLQEYYKKVFPELNVRINGAKLEKDFFLGVTPVASCKSAYTNGIYRGEMVLNVHSENIFDKIGRLLGKSNDNRFYVNSEFVDSFIHENTHIMQTYMKPTDKIYQNTLKRIAETRHPNNIDSWINGYKIDGGLTYSSIVYKEELPLLFKQKKFIQRVKRGISQYYNTEDVKLSHLKQFIRNAELEKQAYEMGELGKLRFKFPKLSKFSFFDKLFKKKANRMTNAFKFDEKINAMKEEYFRMIEAERSKIPNTTTTQIA